MSRHWIVNPDGCGARNLTTGAVTRMLFECSRCETMGYDHDAYPDEEVQALLVEPTALPHVSASISGPPICESCGNNEEDVS